MVYSAWLEVKAMKTAIVKEWDLIGVTRAFDSNFQIAAMATNTTTNLFNIPTTEVQDDGEADEVNLPLSDVVDECLQPTIKSLQSDQHTLSTLAIGKQLMCILARFQKI